MENQIVKTIKKNETEEIRIGLKEYKGKSYFDLRLYYLGKDGSYLPTKKGMMMSTVFLEEFKNAIVAICEYVQEPVNN